MLSLRKGELHAKAGRTSPTWQPRVAPHLVPEEHDNHELGTGVGGGMQLFMPSDRTSGNDWPKVYRYTSMHIIFAELHSAPKHLHTIL